MTVRSSGDRGYIVGKGCRTMRSRAVLVEIPVNAFLTQVTTEQRCTGYVYRASIDGGVFVGCQFGDSLRQFRDDQARILLFSCLLPEEIPVEIPNTRP